MGTQWFTSPVRMKSVCLLAAIVCVVMTSEEVVRKPRLFYVSTVSTTTIISTASVCYVSTTTAAIACGRRKRMITVDGETESVVEPSKSGQGKVEMETSPNVDREGRFLLYWITTTSISTSTSYTTTYSVSAVTCTAPGNDICG